MFSSTKKLDPNLKFLLASSSMKEYRILIQYRNFPDSILKKIHSYRGNIIRKIESCNIICAQLRAKSIHLLLEYPEVKYICLDQYFFLCGMSIPTANKVRISHKLSLYGRGIGVGIIDSGVYPHRDLTYPFNRIITFVDLINELPYPYDDNGHGTCTCGIISGNGSSSNKIYTGVAPESTIHCFKAFDKLGKGYASDVLFALEELINISDQYNIKVICLPFESLNYNKFIFILFDLLLKTARLKSIICIVPSGSNKNIDDSITGIALSNNCITISGIDTTSSNVKSYDYSSCGALKKDTKPNFCAACVDVVSLNSNTSYISYKNDSKIHAPKLDNSYKSFSGTSISAAYIAGICTILFEYNPNFTFDDILSLLKVASISLDLPKNQQGEGKVDVNKILKQ